MRDPTDRYLSADQSVSGCSLPAAVLGLHALWPVGEKSFDVLIAARPSRAPGSPALRHLSETTGPRLTDPTGARSSPRPPTDATIARQLVSRSICIGAPPTAVWPWLAQMMRGAGIYGWSKLETPECRSADTLIPDVGPPAVGDRVSDLLEVVAVEPGRALVWRCTRPLEIGRIAIEELELAYRLDPAGSDGS